MEEIKYSTKLSNSIYNKKIGKILSKYHHKKDKGETISEKQQREFDTFKVWKFERYLEVLANHFKSKGFRPDINANNFRPKAKMSHLKWLARRVRYLTKNRENALTPTGNEIAMRSAKIICDDNIWNNEISCRKDKSLPLTTYMDFKNLLLDFYLREAGPRKGQLQREMEIENAEEKSSLSPPPPSQPSASELSPPPPPPPPPSEPSASELSPPPPPPPVVKEKTLAPPAPESEALLKGIRKKKLRPISKEPPKEAGNLEQSLLKRRRKLSSTDEEDEQFNPGSPDDWQ
jgi:hypothetical protein